MLSELRIFQELRVDVAGCLPFFLLLQDEAGGIERVGKFGTAGKLLHDVQKFGQGPVFVVEKIQGVSTKIMALVCGRALAFGPFGDLGFEGGGRLFYKFFFACFSQRQLGIT